VAKGWSTARVGILYPNIAGATPICASVLQAPEPSACRIDRLVPACLFSVIFPPGFGLFWPLSFGRIHATFGGMLTLEHVADLVLQHQSASRATVREFDIAGSNFPFNSQSSILGVINLSPDSWYRESVCLDADAAIQRGRILTAQGAHLVDLGAESTLAHAARLDVAMQASALLPVVRALRQDKILVSVETYEAPVARACLAAGANVLNLTGTAGTETIYRLAADHSAAVIICYVEGDNVREVDSFDFSGDPILRMHEYFARQIDMALHCGLDRIFIDPGLGFYYRNLQDSALRVQHQMRTFLNTFRLRTLGFPVCHALPHAFEYFRDEVRSAEPFFTVLAALGKTDLFRTHEVPRVRAVLETMRLFQSNPIPAPSTPVGQPATG
jgi:dihydropteroate synthase